MPNLPDLCAQHTSRVLSPEDCYIGCYIVLVLQMCSLKFTEICTVKDHELIIRFVFPHPHLFSTLLTLFCTSKIDPMEYIPMGTSLGWVSPMEATGRWEYRRKECFRCFFPASACLRLWKGLNLSMTMVATHWPLFQLLVLELFLLPFLLFLLVRASSQGN